MTSNPFIKGTELQDKKIIAALHKAAEEYENGELSEVCDTLTDIISAIDTWDKMSQEKGECL